MNIIVRASLFLFSLLLASGICFTRGAAAQMADISFDQMLLDGIDLASSSSIRLSLDKDRNLSSLIAKNSVALRTKQFSLTCDTLVYVAATTTSTSRLEALGNPVHIVQENVFNAVCKKFETYPEDGKSILTGDPVIHYRMGQEESPSVFQGEKITLVRSKDGGTDVVVEGPSHITTKIRSPSPMLGTPPGETSGAGPATRPPETEPAAPRPERTTPAPNNSEANLERISREAADERK